MTKRRKLKIKNEYLELIIALGYDYDGCNTVKSLKKLVDELVELARMARKNDDKTCCYEGGNGKKFNILTEEIKERYRKNE